MTVTTTPALAARGVTLAYDQAVVFRELGVFGLIEMGVFLTLLVIGFVYVWKRGALEWE